MATTCYRGRVHNVSGNCLIASANAAAGYQIVPASAKRTITVVDGWMRALGGNMTQATSMDLTDLTGTVAISWALAALTTAHGILRFDAANVTPTSIGLPLTEGEGLYLITVGTDETTMTSFDYSIDYTIRAT